MVCFQLILLQKYGLFFICANVMVQLFLFFHKNDRIGHIFIIPLVISFFLMLFSVFHSMGFVFHSVKYISHTVVFVSHSVGQRNLFDV